MGKLEMDRLSLLTLLFFCALVLLSPTVNAQFTQIDYQPFPSEKALTIEVSFVDVYKIGQDRNISARVYNNSNGVLINSGVECYFQLYSHTLGNEIIDLETMTLSGEDHLFDLQGTNLTATGYYTELVRCNSSTSGGFIQYTYFINPTGQIVGVEQSVLFSTLLFMILLVGGFSLLLAFKITVPGIQTILIAFAGIMLLFGITYGVNIANDFLSGFESITAGYVLFYRIVIMITWVVFVGLTLYMMLLAVDKIKKIKGVK